MTTSSTAQPASLNRDRARAPSFVDLRALANDFAIILRERADGPDAFMQCREPLWAAGAPSAIGVLHLAGSGRVEAMPADEYVIVIQGAVTLESGQGTIVLAEGESAVLQKDAAFAWQAGDEAILAYMRYFESGDGDAKLVEIGRAPQMAPSGAPAESLLIGPAPACRTHLDYAANDGRFKCGTWDSTPCRRHGFRYPHHEIMHILDGEVTLEDEFGAVRRFVTGDIILAEKGSHCAWDSPAPVTKTFAIYRLAP